MSHIWHKDRLYVSRCGSVMKMSEEDVFYGVCLDVIGVTGCDECLVMSGIGMNWTYTNDKLWDGEQHHPDFHLHIVREIRP